MYKLHRGIQDGVMNHPYYSFHVHGDADSQRLQQSEFVVNHPSGEMFRAVGDLFCGRRWFKTLDVPFQYVILYLEIY